MTQALRWVLSQAEKDEQSAAKAVQEQRMFIAQLEAQLVQLKQYALEYQQQWRAPSEAPISVSQLNHRQVFAAKIENSVHEQSDPLKQAQARLIQLEQLHLKLQQK